MSPGDEVVLSVPIYPGYEPLIRLSGGIPVLADTRNSGFKLTAEVLEPYLTERTKAVILGYPSNPTGRVMSHQELEAVADLLKKRDLFIISDE
ncbi:aminotransferase class I/II-fold pyridoxal phosphate-dependent enzyme, partial [Burkholderia contaminans]|nr:aminotransferase class I/II-fold pyridoxal phosphate-dependent enzyme [Burkholderia contaminans]